MKQWFKRQVLERFKHLKFRNKLILSYVFVIILPVTALGVVSYRQSIDALEQQMAAATDNNLRQVAYSLSSRLDKNNEFIRFTAFCPYVMEELSDSDIQWYELSQRLNNYFEPLSWYNMSINRDFRKLTIYADYLTRPIGSFLEPSGAVQGEEWYRTACAQSDTRWFFDGGELYASRRIYDSGAQVLIGVVHMRMNTEYLMGSVLRRQEAPCGFFLTDGEGCLVYHYTNIPGAAGEPEELLRELVGQGGEGRLRTSGGDYFCASDFVESGGWNLYYYTPSAYTQRAGVILWYTIVTVAACLAVMLLFVWLFSRTLVRRIDKLGQKMALVEQGDLGVSIHSDSKDEIGQLTNGFGRMLRRVNELIDQVYTSQITQKDAELKSLQSQINPHFLYNTLSLINWKAIEADSPEISRIAGLLSQFYRTSLNRGENRIAVKGELDNVRAYVELQLVMHEHDFDVEYQVDEAVYDCATVNFTLQPLVENAILHGIDEHEGVRGKLVIRAEVQGGDILFAVSDNGVGMDPEFAASLTGRETAGYGLKNVNERIKLVFGEEYGVWVESAPGRGTTAFLRIRKRDF
ncbi:cache domain-containing sensor histidine kinase [Allofournierella sp.]|uniref:cache domain-containing sensor histidine kinase n=1 Tax=Allofournierella sp. TaxID=1940256 RepID=UPI003AB2D796